MPCVLVTMWCLERKHEWAQAVAVYDPALEGNVFASDGVQHCPRCDRIGYAAMEPLPADRAKWDQFLVPTTHPEDLSAFVGGLDHTPNKEAVAS